MCCNSDHNHAVWVWDARHCAREDLQISLLHTKKKKQKKTSNKCKPVFIIYFMNVWCYSSFIETEADFFIPAAVVLRFSEDDARLTSDLSYVQQIH